jgi:hypothetical protein
VWLSTNCGDLHFLLGTAVECVPLTLTWPSASPNQEMWLWVGPSVFTGVPESDYTFQICGIQGGPVRIQEMSWGAVKARFRNPSARASGEANGAREPRRPVVRRTISRGTPAADRPWDRSSARAPLKDRGKPSGVSGSPEGGVLKP